MIDTGSEITLVNRKLIEEVNLTNLIYKIPRVNLVGANKRTLATINEGIRVMVRLGKKMYALQCVIMPNMSHDMIVGVDELAEKHVVIDFKNNTMNLTEEKEEEQNKEQEKQNTDKSGKERTVEMNLATKQGQRRKGRKSQKKTKENETCGSSKEELSPEEEKLRVSKAKENWDSSKEEMSSGEGEIKLTNESEKDIIETVAFEEEAYENEDAECTVKVSEKSEEKDRRLIWEKGKDNIIADTLTQDEDTENKETITLQVGLIRVIQEEGV
ncbi:cilia- and flagella-associated protein 251-like [Diabrotica virgifera virgifera]|uniref:Peptidase A2 domain-containing protein n=1 Tax=Diabrotica virgifera virgifera TaxID=50390 RepID=A0ABM5JM17_DIAVI|nr:cilia- and flagella-associated protein 251-like [Diabrotica virgifera virgifera]